MSSVLISRAASTSGFTGGMDAVTSGASREKQPWHTSPSAIANTAFGLAAFTYCCAKRRSLEGLLSDVLGGQVVLEENPCIVKLANGWIIMNPGGGPTPDKPDISVVPYEPSNEVSSFLNLRVPISRRATATGRPRGPSS